MIGKRSRAKGDYNPYQNNVSGGFAVGSEGVAEGVSSFQPASDNVANLVNSKPLPTKGDESACSDVCEVLWKPVRATGS